MIGEVTVTLITVETTSDAMGDTTTETTEQDVPGCLFAPVSSAERSATATPTTVISAALFLPPSVPAIGPNDVFVIAERWYQVEGVAAVWGTAGVEVTLSRWEN